MPRIEIIQSNLLKIKEEIRLYEQRFNRVPDSVKLVAVSKYFPTEAILAAYRAGQRLFGENRVQELTDKVKVLPGDIAWHMIGHLQSNKARQVVSCADYIHAVDSVKLLLKLERIAADLQTEKKILLEINVSGEKSKFGLHTEEAKHISEEITKLKWLKLEGLMTMAPAQASSAELHSIFGGVRKLRDIIATETGLDLPELSMGMSSDFKEAIAEGATLVRVGSAIFGSR